MIATTIATWLYTDHGNLGTLFTTDDHFIGGFATAAPVIGSLLAGLLVGYVFDEYRIAVWGRACTSASFGTLLIATDVFGDLGEGEGLISTLGFGIVFGTVTSTLVLLLDDYFPIRWFATIPLAAYLLTVCHVML